MKRTELLRYATQLAHEQVDAHSALNDAEYKKHELLTDKDAIKNVAVKILIKATWMTQN